MKERLFLVLSVSMCANVFCELTVADKKTITETAIVMASHFDSFPDPKYQACLDSFGVETIPVVNELLYTTEGLRKSAMVSIFSQLKGNNQMIVDGLRNFILQEARDINDRNESGLKKALYWLAKRGEQSDVELIGNFEGHTNRFVSATARSARIKLEQRLEQEKLNKRPVVSQPIHTPVLNSTDVVDKTPRMIVPQEVVAPNVQPNQKRTSRKAFPYLVVIGGILLGILGFLLVVTRKRPRKSE